MSDQGGFKCRKWTLFSLTLVVIIINIVVVILSINVINDWKQNNFYPSLTKDELEAAKKVGRSFIIGVGVVSLLIQLLGLFGAYKENYCLTLTYAILMTLATLASIYSALESSVSWTSFAFYLVITILAYMFARDIKRMRFLQNVPNQPGWVA